LVQIKLVLVQLLLLRAQLRAERDELAAVLEQIAGKKVVAPALNVRQAALDLPPGGTRGERGGAQRANQGFGGEGLATGGEVCGCLQHAQRDVKLDLGREA